MYLVLGVYLVLGGVLSPRGCLVWGVSGPRGCLPRGCLVWEVYLVWGVSGPRGVSDTGGVSGTGGGLCLVWGGLVPGGCGIPAYPRQTPPPLNRMTDRCKNITLATTSLRPVKIGQ